MQWRGSGVQKASALSLAFVLVGISLPLTSYAASSSNITTSPISQDLVAKPGSTVSTTLMVENNGSTPLPISLQLKTFKANGTSGQAQITNPAANDPSLSWVHFSQTSFVAQPGVFQSVQMTISVPSDAKLGYYYAVLFKPVLSPAAQNNSTNTVSLSNAVLVLVDTSSTNEVRQLQVSSLTSQHKLYQYLPATINIVVHNTGNIYVPPSGEVYISKHSDFSHLLATIPINKAAGRVLPDSSRLFSIKWSDGFPAYQQQTIGGQPVYRKGQPVMQLHYNFSSASSFRFGRYYAKMVLVYNNGQRDVPITGMVSFWVIPWKLLLAVLLIILLQVGIVIAAIRYRRMYRVTSRTSASGESVKVNVKSTHKD